MLLDPQIHSSPLSILPTQSIPMSASPPPPTSHLLDDIFSDSPTHSPTFPNSHSTTHPSDIPRLRATHSTAGYREGLSASKTTAIQLGFDEGYTLGATLGLKVGELLGVLEGVCAALGNRRKENIGAEGLGESGEEVERVFELRRKAGEELELRRVFAEELWGSDGVWRWDVQGGGNEKETNEQDVGKKNTESPDEEITFEAVAAAHPVIKKWTAIVEGVMREWGVRKGVFEGAEWEAGRVGGDG